MKTLNFKMQTAFLVIGLALSATSQAMPSPHADRVWNGYYFGAYFGAGAGTTHTTLTSHDEDFFNSPSSTTIDQFVDLDITDTSGNLKGKVTGSIADLFVGYNFYQPCWSMVFGAQIEGTIFSDITWKSKGDLDIFDTSTEVDVDDDGTDVDFDATLTTTSTEVIDRLHSKVALVGRIGYLFNPCTLVYGLGGVVEGHFVIPAAVDDFGGTRNQWELGYTLGLGGELKVSDHWSIRGEYRYLSFNYDRRVSFSDSSTSVALSSGGIPSFDFDSSTFTQKTTHKFRDHLGEVGVVYAF